MATKVGNEVCNTCGADVRPQALFCYNCGGAVGEKTSEAKPLKKINDEKTPQSENKKIGEIVDQPIPKPEIQKPKKLKSAADLRRRTKIFQQNKVEIVWEEHENAPNIWFIVVSGFLIFLAAVILFLAMYLK